MVQNLMACVLCYSHVERHVSVVDRRGSVVERRGSVVVSTSACHAAGRGSLLGPGASLGVTTWLSTCI